tara:strand:+ start:321 stop:527 length:207 start_codon:yes stop_codon:yes gene_type:complete
MGANCSNRRRIYWDRKLHHNQKTDHHSIISVTRICHSVINRVPVLLEFEGAANQYTNLCITAGPGNII